jgi:translation initiation factor IF-1
MNKENIVNGEIIKALPNTMFRVKAEDGRVLLCTLSGKMRVNRIRVMMGDKVKVQTTPYDEKRGRIVYRVK